MVQAGTSGWGFRLGLQAGTISSDRGNRQERTMGSLRRPSPIRARKTVSLGLIPSASRKAWARARALSRSLEFASEGLAALPVPPECNRGDGRLHGQAELGCGQPEALQGGAGLEDVPCVRGPAGDGEQGERRGAQRRQVIELDGRPKRYRPGSAPASGPSFPSPSGTSAAWPERVRRPGRGCPWG